MKNLKFIDYQLFSNSKMMLWNLKNASNMNSIFCVVNDFNQTKYNISKFSLIHLIVFFHIVVHVKFTNLLKHNSKNNMLFKYIKNHLWKIFDTLHKKKIFFDSIIIKNFSIHFAHSFMRTKQQMIDINDDSNISIDNVESINKKTKNKNKKTMLMKMIIMMIMMMT